VIQRLAIVGVGLLGGSVARAARARGLAGHIIGIGRDRERLAPALKDGTLDVITTDVAEGVRDADLIVLAATVLANDALLAQVWQAAPSGTIVTDVGSTKRGIVAAAARLGQPPRVRFVASHPMAGSERSGYAIARADLLEGATVIVTPTDAADPEAVKTVVGFWEATGARVVTMDPETHDRAVGAVSHLTHVVAWALVDGVARFEPAAMEVAARGFRDTTRIAASDPVMWKEILLANRDVVVAGLRAFRAALDDLERQIAAGDGAGIEATLARIKALRETIK
jgi:prephenate dehydrogenase